MPTSVIPATDSPAFKRLEDGHYIGAGACNPGAILRTMVRHLDADSTLHHHTLCNDPGMRQMLYQLVYLFELEGGKLEDNFSRDYNACRDVSEAARKARLAEKEG